MKRESKLTEKEFTKLCDYVSKGWEINGALRGKINKSTSIEQLCILKDLEDVATKAVYLPGRFGG